MRVRSKPAARKHRRSVRPWMLGLSVAVIAGVGTLWYDYNWASLGIIPHELEIEQTSRGQVFRVPPGGNIQAALERANGGDVIELQAGAVYPGEIKLPDKPLNDYVTIQTSSAAKLPADNRVGPSDRSSMAAIMAGSFGRPAVSASNGAHHYRFVGIEFSASTATYNYGLIALGSGETRPEMLPHHIEIDRSYIHPHKTGVTRRGIALNSADTVVKNSYIEGFAYPGEETQGICGWTGTRNVTIVNNYIEGGAENIMFGGADPASAELIPRDIEVRGNHLNKRREWPSNATVKTLFELKNAIDVRFTGNYLENNLKGSAFRITVRNQDGGATFSTIEDVIISGNIINGSGDGINILGKDYTHPSQTLKRLSISNNLFLNISGNTGYEGSGYFLQVADGEDITIVNNTAFNDGNIVTFYGAMPRAFTFTDNIVGHGNYGIHGPIDQNSVSARAMFQNNVFINLNGVPSGDFAFPQGNTIVGSISEVGFANAASRDFRLAPGSKFRGKGRGGKNVGSDLAPR